MLMLGVHFSNGDSFLDDRTFPDLLMGRVVYTTPVTLYHRKSSGRSHSYTVDFVHRVTPKIVGALHRLGCDPQAVSCLLLKQTLLFIEVKCLWHFMFLQVLILFVMFPNLQVCFCRDRYCNSGNG